MAVLGCCWGVVVVDEARAEAVIDDDAARLGVLVEAEGLGRGVAAGAVDGQGGGVDGAAHELLDEGVLHEPRAPDHDAGADLVVAVLLDLEQEPAGLGVGADASGFFFKRWSVSMAVERGRAGWALCEGRTVTGSGRREGGWLYVLDAVAGLDADVLAVEDAHRIGREGLVEHGEDLGGDVVHGDVDVGHEGRIRALQVLVYEIMELRRVPGPVVSSVARHLARGSSQMHSVRASEPGGGGGGDILDTRGTATDDGEVEELAAGFIGCFWM